MCLSDFSVGLGALVYVAGLALLLPAARYLARRGIYRRAAHGGLPAQGRGTAHRRLDNRE